MPAPKSSPAKKRSKSEATFGQLLEKSRQLHQYLLSLPDYDPQVPDITAPNYKLFLDQVAQINSSVDAATAALRLAREERSALYHGESGLLKRAARIRDYLASLPGGKKSAVFKRAQKICQSLRPGGTKSQAPEPTGQDNAAAKKKISQYEVSFGSMLAKGRELEQIILTHTGYNPSMSDITPAGFDALLDQIELKNAEVAAKLAIANEKISTRERAYSTQPQGLRGRAARIKAAIAGQYGRNSAQYKNALEIKF